MGTHYQGTEFEQRALNLYLRLVRGCDALTQCTLAPVLRSGLTPTQFGVLDTLWHLGPLKPSQLAAKHHRSRNNLSVVIDQLEKEGLVQRARCPVDRRAQWIHLTECGRIRIEATFPEFLNALMTAVSALSPSEQNELGELAKRLGKHAELHPWDPDFDD